MTYTKITKDNIDTVLSELAKTYRRLAGKQKAEIIIVGGSAAILQYPFRAASQDVDAIIRAGGALKDAAVIVGEKYGLDHEWLNSDFQKTSSFSTKIIQHSRYYKTFSNVLEIRVIAPEYLIAMKLKASRVYKHDLSDAIGVIAEERSRGNEMSLTEILDAYRDMYGDALMDSRAKNVLEKAFSGDGGLGDAYNNLLAEEKAAHDALIDFQDRYPGVLSEDNLERILLSIDRNSPEAKEEHAPTAEDDANPYLTEDDDVLTECDAPRFPRL